MKQRAAISAGDVGSTNVHLFLYDFSDGKLGHIRDSYYSAKHFSGLKAIAEELGQERQCSQSEPLSLNR